MILSTWLLIGIMVLSWFIIFLYYKYKYKNWKSPKEVQSLIQERIKKSNQVRRGKFVEQLAPFLPGFKYNPEDARFIGSPIDFIIFDGNSGREPKSIIFMEVKSGKANLTQPERIIKDLVERGKVKWEIFRVNNI